MMRGGDYDVKFRLSYFYKCKESIDVKHLNKVLTLNLLIHAEFAYCIF